MLLKRRASRGRRLSRSEILTGLCFLALIVLMTVLAIYLNLWWLKQEEGPEKNQAPIPRSTLHLNSSSRLQ